MATNDGAPWDGPTAYDMLLMVKQNWVGQEGPLLRLTLKKLGERPRAEYREALDRVFVIGLLVTVLRHVVEAGAVLLFVAVLKPFPG